MSDEIINKVTTSSLVQLDLEAYYPKEQIVLFDLQPHLYMGLILKEKEFREALQNHDWTIYQNKLVAVTCTADAIIPAWAYMLVASYIQPVAIDVVFGTESEALKQKFISNIGHIDAELFRGQRVVVKGCGDVKIDDYAFLEVTKKLRPVAKSIMYGEPCSTVPIFKVKSER